jgi:hypothetical protein
MASVMRNGAPWSVAFALGLWQSKALGMQWNRIDFKAGTVRAFQIHRPRYRHGCENAHACGAKWHKRECKQPCKQHKKRRPKPCQGLPLHANHCSKCLGCRWEFNEPTGRKAWTIVIPTLLLS